MPDTQCDVAALVYDEHHDPDAVLRDFTSALNVRGLRVAGLVQAGQCADSSLSAILLHSGETLLLAQDADPLASGCRLDLSRLQTAGARVADALEAGADLLIVNRFGKRERGGKGLAYLIERAIGAGIPVVIAVSAHHLADWTKFIDGKGAKLHCDRQSLDAWWQDVSMRSERSASEQLPGTSL
jgi:hypothetical protein